MVKSASELLNAVILVSGTLLSLGIITFLFGILESGYNNIASIGIGITMGAVFIFLIGIFFVATEEMLNKTDKGIKRIPIYPKKKAPL